MAVREVKIAKGGGRYRVVYVPDQYTRDLCARAAPVLAGAAIAASASVDRWAGYPVAHCRPGRSAVTAAAQHVGYAWTLQADLAECYDRILWWPYSAAVGRGDAAYWAYRIHVECGGRRIRTFAPQGLSTSPAVAEAALTRVDRDVLAWLASRGSTTRWRYTRYADDLAISADDRCLLEQLRGELPALLGPHGHKPARGKVHLSGGPNRRVILGRSVGAVDQRASRDIRRRERAAWHRVAMLLRDAVALHAAGWVAWASVLAVVAAYSAMRARGLTEAAAGRSPDHVRAALRLAARGPDWAAAARLIAAGL